jgi:hypothetical protein
MSFAAALYDLKKKDVVIGTDRRWCCPPDVRFNNCYHSVAENAVKCLRLERDIGIAFTGSSSLIRSVLSTVYGDITITTMDELKFGELLEGRDISGSPSLSGVAALIDSVVPGLMQAAVGAAAEGDLSIFLAGKNGMTGDPHVIYWCKSTTWHGRPYPMAAEALRTLPPECASTRDYKEKLTKEVDAILRDQDTPAIARIKNAISHLARQEHVVSVNGEWIVRSLKHEFVRL